MAIILSATTVWMVVPTAASPNTLMTENPDIVFASLQEGSSVSTMDSTVGHGIMVCDSKKKEEEEDT
jgi:hypothetical protein